jgi:hypothetical protein
MLITTRTTNRARIVRRVALCAASTLLLTFPHGLHASTIFMGSNGTAPNDQIQMVTPAGLVAGVLPPHDASAAALDGNGNLFVALPGDIVSTIQEFNSFLTQIGSFTFSAPVDTRPSASYIVDLGWGMSSLWASTFSGMVYQLSTAGAVLSSFDTGVSSPGVTSDGTSLYTTSGLGLFSAAPFVYQRTSSGAITNTIDTGLNDTLGIGFDASTNSLWIGGIDVLSQVSLQGSVLQQFALDGEHTGVEVGDLQPAAAVFEPTTMLLVGIGSAGIGLLRRKAQSRQI